MNQIERSCSEKIMEIRFVEPWEWSAVEGIKGDRPWLLAQERFASYFADVQYGRHLYELVELRYGCFALNAIDWAIAMNTVIAMLNGLAEDAGESDLIECFGL